MLLEAVCAGVSEAGEALELRVRQPLKQGSRI